MNTYKIYVATYGAWNLEGQTESREIARATVKSLRAGGRLVMIKLNGKKVNWKI